MRRSLLIIERRPERKSVIIHPDTYAELPGLADLDWKGVSSVSGSPTSGGDRLKGSWRDDRVLSSVSDRAVRFSFRF